jgi:hypothetical protein
MEKYFIALDWSFGTLGFEPITPVLHHSITPTPHVQQPPEE